jgi:spore germination cell wall hydrolase CwlJ-like protein
MEKLSPHDPRYQDAARIAEAVLTGQMPEEGKAAVAHVILNRMRSGKWGDNIKDVVTGTGLASV